MILAVSNLNILFFLANYIASEEKVAREWGRSLSRQE
jgi:hypothetical protein